jgi:diguanylate cyclase (GGDEF)-like protein
MPILGVQVICIGLLSAIAFWSGWYSLRQAEALRRTAMAEAQRIRVVLRQHARTVHEDMGVVQARASLQLLRSAMLESARTHAPGQMEAITSNLDALEAATAPIFESAPGSSRDEALRRYDAQLETIYAVVDQLDAATSQGVGDLRVRAIHVILACWLLAIGVYGCTGAWARLRFLAREQERRRELDRNRETLVLELEAAASGDRTHVVESGPDLQPLARAANAVIEELSVARERLAAERHRARFNHELVEALDLADSEPEICATAAEAARVAFPGAQLQVLLADNSHARLEPQFQELPDSCSPGSPRACPAIRRSRTVVNAPDGGLGRCPRLKEMPERVACAAISVHGRAVGALQIIGVADIPPPEIMLTSMCYGLGARLGIVRSLGASELAAATDALTGLANRRAMNERLQQLERGGGRFAVVSADLDHFKRLNDTYGHQVGDRCLRVFAQVLRGACREADLACRPGGEEFAAILGGADVDGASAVASRIHGSLAEANRAAGIPFTVSLGIAAYPIHGATTEEILQSADAALYAAKEGGRNCTRVFAMAGSSPAGSRVPQHLPECASS